MKKTFVITAAILLILLLAVVAGAVADRLFTIKPLDMLFGQKTSSKINFGTKVATEESVVIGVAEKSSPSVVTVSATISQRKVLQFSPFGGFSQKVEGGSEDIGSGFIVSTDGLIITNKHVVVDTSATYKVITKDGKEYEVDKISRDPVNDIAVLKIKGDNLTPIELGDSSNLKVGQFVVAIGTALGEFRHTVTTGVISGLGRGIEAGSPLQGYVEELSNIIQTDAAINPGNSGGPLINSSGQVIGINVAVAQGAQNIGFAIPINIIKDALIEFNKNGEFPAKAFLGVQYQMITKESAILNNVPQGAYVTDVVPSSPAESSGMKRGDIIIKIDGKEINEESGGISKIISTKKPGDKVTLEVWQNGNTATLTAILTEAKE